MAGRGPLPKPPDQRVGRHKPRLGEVRTAPGTGWQHGPIPRAPAGLSTAAREAWRVWFTSWWAAFWSPMDLAGLRIVAHLYSEVMEGDTRLAGELRQWCDTYGISPKGRQSLRWAPPKAAEPPLRPAEQDAGPYSELRIVAANGTRPD